MKTPHVVLYIDAANLVLTARAHGIEYTHRSLLQFLKDTYRANACVYFTGNIPALATDYAELRALGVELVFKEIYSEQAKTKANCDVEIAHRVTRDVERAVVDTVVLVSGDGDFASLLDYVNDTKRAAYVFAVHPRNTSRLLRRRRYVRMSYLCDIASDKRKGPVGHVAPTGRLFDSASILRS